VGAVAIDSSGNVWLRDASEAVGAGGDQERRVVGTHRVEVDAEREHALKQLNRRHHVVDAGLQGPVCEAGDVHALAHGDGTVLVPAEGPVPIKGFVEQGGANGARGGAEDGASNVGGGGDEIVAAVQAREAGAGATWINAGEHRQQMRDLIGCEGGWEMLGPFGGELHAPHHRRRLS